MIFRRYVNNTIFARRAMMKYAAVLIAFLMVCGVCVAGEQKIASVDMTKLLRGHPETEKAEEVLEEQVREIEQEKKTLMSKLEEMRDEVDGIIKQGQNRALSDAKRESIREEAEVKFKELRKMDFQAKKKMDTRKKDLAEQKMMMHRRIVGKISDVISDFAEKEGYAFVVDSSSVSMSGMPSILYADADTDITKDIKKLISKK